MPTYWSCWSRWRNASMNRPDVSVQRRTRLPDLHFQFFELFVVDVIKPPRHVETVADLRKRCASSIEKLKLFLFMIAGATFNDVYRDRESGAARLRREFEQLVSREGGTRQRVQLDEQVVSTLPRDKGVMA